MSHPVVAGIDGSPESRVAGEWAAQEAELRGLPLRLVHAAEAPDPGSADLPVAFLWRQRGEDALRHAEADLAARHPRVTTSSVRVTDSAAAALLSASATAGLLVVGARGDGGFDGLAVGSTALEVARGASCPVVVVPGPGSPSAGRQEAEVAVGVGSGPVDESVLDFAFESAGLRGVRLRVVHAWALPGVPLSAAPMVPEEDRGAWEDQEVQRLSDALRGFTDRYPEVPVLHDVVLLHPAQALVHASQQAALLVLGRFSGPRAAERRLGPVAHAVLHHARCPVAVVPRT
ncbi:universal stress protein [Streptomyces thermoalcalitolerans]|uniref:Universal stress protein n=1 Tax=Streptomyces thermoalcalitolerans TaxID=65605 RepID=A0ABP3ZJJ3_9ACTN